MSIPDGVRELCDECFKGCKHRRCVTFGPLSSLERISAQWFASCGLAEFEMPMSVRSTGGGAFGECALACGIVCSDGCRFLAFEGLITSDDCETCYCSYDVLSSVRIPDDQSFKNSQQNHSEITVDSPLIVTAVSTSVSYGQ